MLSPTLYNPMDYSPPGSSVHGILGARKLEWLAISSSRGSSKPRDQTCVSCISCTSEWILYHCATQGPEYILIWTRALRESPLQHDFPPKNRFWKYLQHLYTVQWLPLMLTVYHTGTLALKSSFFKVLQKLFLLHLHKSRSRAGACHVRQPPGAMDCL